MNTPGTGTPNASRTGESDGAPVAAPRATTTASPLWFLGTLARMKITGEHTGGRFAL